MSPSGQPRLSARQRFTRRLRQIRAFRGYSQEHLAELCGLHRTYVSSVERGERNITIDNMERLAQALGVDIVDLLIDAAYTPLQLQPADS